MTKMTKMTMMFLLADLIDEELTNGMLGCPFHVDTMPSMKISSLSLSLLQLWCTRWPY